MSDEFAAVGAGGHLEGIGRMDESPRQRYYAIRIRTQQFEGLSVSDKRIGRRKEERIIPSIRTRREYFDHARNYWVRLAVQELELRK